jgi:hypothetical protein
MAERVVRLDRMAAVFDALTVSDPIYLPLRTSIIAAGCLSVALVAYSILRYPAILAAPGAPVLLSVFAAGITAYVFAAVRWSRIKTHENFLILRNSLKWGIAIGLSWTVEVIGANVIVPHQLGAAIGAAAAVVAAILPIIAGAVGTAATGRMESGARVGLWSGVVSGLITFVVLATVGLLVLHFPGLPGVETPRNPGKTLTADELAAFNLGDYLAGGVSHLVLIGAPFCGIAGTVGGALARPRNRP